MSENLPSVRWRTSSYSGENGGTCVQLGSLDAAKGVVGVRDSKDPDQGHLTLSPESFSGLILGIQSGSLDLPW